MIRVHKCNTKPVCAVGVRFLLHAPITPYKISFTVILMPPVGIPLSVRWQYHSAVH